MGSSTFGIFAGASFLVMLGGIGLAYVFGYASGYSAAIVRDKFSEKFGINVDRIAEDVLLTEARRMRIKAPWWGKR